MNMKPFFQRILLAFCAFAPATSGNVAATFALATVPIVGFVGSAVDYSRGSSLRSAMQAAVDSTALMLSKDAATLSNSDLNAKALSYFKALMTRPEAKNIAVTATYSTGTGASLVLNSSATMDTNFMGLLGYKQLNINASSTTAWGSTRLRVALALDNTGSMADSGKMTALKSATKTLLTQLKNAAATSADVYVSIVPFSKDVNVGSSNYAGNWIDWSDWDDDNGHDTSTTTCTTTKTGKSGKSTKKCSTTTTWVPDNHNTWNGCITDRDQNYDQTVTAANPADASLADSATSTLYPAEQYDYCPVAMMGLNNNWTNMNSLVDQMYPNGNTNQPIGLVWGWLSLVGGGPFTVPAKDANYKYQDIIILMSDGLNTENRWSTSQTQVDKRMYDSSKSGAGTCANIKATGVTIYTIHVNTNGDPTSTLLQNCASGTDKFFLVTSSSGIASVFNTIGTNLTKLRVAK